MSSPSEWTLGGVRLLSKERSDGRVEVGFLLYKDDELDSFLKHVESHCKGQVGTFLTLTAGLGEERDVS